HSAAKKLDIALALAYTAALSSAGEACNVHFRRRLREGEVMRSESYLYILSEKLFRENLKRSLKVAHGNALIDNKTLALMENRRMGSVHFIGSVNRSGAYGSDREYSPFHRPYLYGRSLRS